MITLLQKQMKAMDSFVDAMDLMEAGDKDDEGYAYGHSGCEDMAYAFLAIVSHGLAL